MYSFKALAEASAHREASLAVQSSIDAHEVYQAALQSRRYAPFIHSDRAHRVKFRNLFDAAHAIGGVTMAVTYIKDDGVYVRTIWCQPLVPKVDRTCRYVTVWDLEVGGYRRINLDGIVKVTMETSAEAPQCPEAGPAID